MTNSRSVCLFLRGASALVCFLGLLVFSSVGVAETATIEAERGKADLILYNGHVLTVDRDFSIAEAVAVSGGKILAVGDSSRVRKLGGENTRLIDLRGAAVLPGINDSHIHLAWWGDSLTQVELRGKNLEEIRAAVAERVANSAPGEVIRGVGWSEASIGRLPTRADLDDITPENPVAFEEIGHGLWVNTRMLELAGIEKDASDPPGGRFERDSSTGQLTGLLHEADHLVVPHIPEVPAETRKRNIVNAIDRLNREGVTSLTEPGAELQQLALYEELAEEGALSARVSVHLKAGRSLQEAKDVLAAYPGDVRQRGVVKQLLNVRGIKLYMDGAPPGKTALMFEDYACCPGEKGILVYRGESLKEQVEEINRSMAWLHGQGYQMGVHTDGDHSANIAIEGLTLAMGNPATGARSNPLRHYLIHGDLVTDEDIARMAQWHIGLTTQPVITNSAGHLVSELWGPARGNRHMAPGLFVRAGVWTSLSTDAPIVPPDWKQNIEFAVLRKNNWSPPEMARPEYRVSVEEAIIAYTRTPAYQDFQEDTKGTIEVGKVADLVVIDRNPLAVDPRDISELRTLMTVLGGDIVYENLADSQ